MPDYFEQDESGKIAKQYSDEAFLRAVEANEPASTSEVAESVGCTRRNADVRLRKLADEGTIRRTKIAGRQVWFSSIGNPPLT